MSPEGLVRRPARFDFGARYPRLVAGGTGTPDTETQNELILNAAGEGIYGLDVNGHCTFVNPAAARMTGHDAEELLGKSMHDMVHHTHEDGRSYPAESCPIYAAFKDGMVRNVCEDVFWHKNGSAFPVEYTSTPIFNGEVLVGAVVVFRDITLRRRTEDRLRGALLEVQRLKEQLQRENTNLRQAIQSARELRDIVGSSPRLCETLRLVRRVAPTESTVLIQGETGTGKELVARAIHQLSARSGGPLVRVNCAAISPQLADSELFGHERGAFTGAVGQRVGRFEQARGGTLFLDEVGELRLETQSKLLRVLQEREFERVGGTETLAADVRVVAATNRDLKAAVRRGTFRADLFFRLNVLPLQLPPLRERLGDLPELVEAFLARLEARSGRALGKLTRESLERLAAYHFPGNIRELENVIEYAAVLSDGGPIEISDELLSFVGEAGTASDVQGTATTLASGSAEAPLPIDAGERPRATADPSPEEPTLPPAAPSSVNAPGIAPRSLKDVERRHILETVESAHWRLAGPGGAAALLGIHPNTLRHRMKKLGIRR